MVKGFVHAYLGGDCADVTVTAVTGDTNIKALTFSEILAQTSNLKKNEADKKSAFAAIAAKINTNPDSIGETPEEIDTILKVVDEMGTN